MTRSVSGRGEQGGTEERQQDERGETLCAGKLAGELKRSEKYKKRVLHHRSRCMLMRVQLRNQCAHRSDWFIDFT